MIRVWGFESPYPSAISVGYNPNNEATARAYNPKGRDLLVNICSYGQAVKLPAFHAGVTGSNPVSCT